MSVNKKIIETEATLPQTAGFNVVTWTGNGGTQSITGVGFQPDFVWIKVRSVAGYSHVVFDSTRGATKRIYPDTSAAENSNGKLSSFDTDGFTFNGGGSSNVNGLDMVAWCWKANGGTTSSNTDGSITSTVQANTAAGFSIVKYTGTGAQGTIGHGLSAAPAFIISKRLDSSNNWSVYHKDLGLSHSTYPNWMYLNSNSTRQISGSSANHPYYQAPSSTLLYQNTGTSELTNVSGGEYISYCFAGIDSFSKFGTYAGNGTSQSINIGFQPDLLILRKYDDNQDWMIWDSVRDGNPKTLRLEANNGDAEVSGTTNINFISTGFEFTSGFYNDSGKNSIYMAFKIN